MRFFLVFFLQCLLLTQLFSQRSFDTVEYRSANNPYYWKNRKPHQAYWQQDVKLKMDVKLNDMLDFIESEKFELTYFNNSPHTLKELYFHINEQAFQPGSYYDDLNRNNGIKPKFGKYEKQGFGTSVKNIKIDGIEVEATFDNTVFRVNLPKPLQANDSVLVTLDFKTYFDAGGSLRRRMKMYNAYGFKHFDAVHWYPQIAVYDAKAGWNVDQHLDKEFYNNFGSFEVSINLPAEYVMEATGVLMNQSEVMPDDLRKKLDLKNFKDKPFGEKPSIITERLLDENGDPETKTWKYFATNVHNFVFTADPLYRIDEKEWNGIKAIALVQEPHSSRWLPSAKFAARVIEVFSKDFGVYVWPKIIVADARDGMEYPMITLDNGTYPGHQQLLAHEIGHMWFYGMVGNNETYRAMLDEGFTQFLTVWAMDSIVGPSRTRTHKRKWVTKHLAKEQTLNDRLYYPYLRTVNDDRDEPLNTHSHYFNGAIRHGGSYGLVYFKTGVMLHNLRYVLGDSLFLAAMRHYFEKWKFCHPYPEDFRNAVTEVAQTDLNWFFDQWMETTKTIDYSVKSLNSQKTDSCFVNKITLKRLGRMQMPLEVTLTGKSGKAYHALIPNTWFIKKVDSSTKVLHKWYGWDLLKPTYELKMTTPEKIVKVEIDTSLILADIDRSNNILSKRIPIRGTELKFDHRVPNTERWDKPVAYWRPDFWYNGVDGIQAGAVLRGEYFKNIYEYELSAWANTGIGKRNDQLKLLEEKLFIEQQNNDWRNLFSYDVRLRKKMNRLGRFVHFNASSWMNAGTHFNQLGFEKKFQNQDNRNLNYYLLQLDFNSIYRFDRRHALFPYFHSHQLFNNFSELNLTRYYAHHTLGRGQIQGKVRTPFWNSDFNYSFIQLEEKHFYALKKLDFALRLFGRYGIANNSMPSESGLYLSGGNPEGMLHNKYYRAMGIAEYDASYQSGIYHFSGGLNVRGFNNQLDMQNAGFSGIAANIEVEWDRFLKIKPKKWSSPFHVDAYWFADIGSLASQNNKNEIIGFLPVVASTGLGAVTSVNFRPYNIKPLKIRTDFPLLTSQTTSGNVWQPMFLIGFDKLF